ncbi:protein of unknown function [Legionella fallonii LLAP-10]|uniref:Uncharacterized protein n=1 Tax=Legionella fallonii LLAP-10 TaxID=1212491 RepID=A0A098G3S6_9GAMM|nr:protein of unknown function [Legionella fallonii LLAP-10]
MLFDGGYGIHQVAFAGLDEYRLSSVIRNSFENGQTRRESIENQIRAKINQPLGLVMTLKITIPDIIWPTSARKAIITQKELKDDVRIYNDFA